MLSPQRYIYRLIPGTCKLAFFSSPFLEKSTCRWNTFKDPETERSPWVIQVGPKSMTRILIRDRREDRQRRMPCDDGSMDWNEAATTKGHLEFPEAGKVKERSPLEPLLGEGWQGVLQTPGFGASGLQNCKKVSVILSHSRHRKLIVPASQSSTETPWLWMRRQPGRIESICGAGAQLRAVPECVSSPYSAWKVMQKQPSDWPQAVKVFFFKC